MAKRYLIEPEIEWLTSLSTIVGAYEEIAAARMRKIRDKVFQNREFLTGLNHVFRQVKSSYRQEAARHKKLRATTKNSKTVSVLVSANTGLYGDIVLKTLELFLGGIKNVNTDIVTIGKLGSRLFQEREPSRDFVSFELPDSAIGYDQFRQIADHLLQYEKVVVYHGLFKSILTQTPASSNISGDQELTPGEEAAKERWLFEPSLEDVLTFFESEIFSSLFVHALHESQLAKYASRMVTLDEAGENIKKSLRTMSLTKERLRHRQINRKMLGALAGRSFPKR